eukprot:TRINITY_DN43865_c0_g1_i1.p1 TRINITY_DN43865_c0_g1~~TRINITY_DN43865_c0_g1_i1.p1  ORF type:complete len:553 (+),score=70.13 TRINITY_DN43865_c0_g1_i1:67-1725(+)
MFVNRQDRQSVVTAFAEISRSRFCSSTLSIFVVALVVELQKMVAFSSVGALASCWLVFRHCLVSCLDLKEPTIARPQRVQLHKQRVPVQSADGLVSFKSIYFGSVYLGSPRTQKFSVVFDTGSGHVVVPSVACESEACAMHRRYNESMSAVSYHIDHDGKTIQPGEPRDQLTVAYGTGEVTGLFVVERVCLDTNSRTQVSVLTVSAAEGSVVASNGGSVASGEGGSDHPVVSDHVAFSGAECTTLYVVAATAMSTEPFSSFSFDGILGLSFSELALSPDFNFFWTLLKREQNSLPSKTFGVFLADDRDDLSEISFGGVNMARFSSPLEWANVALADLGHWQVHILSLSIGHRTLDFCADGECRAVVDTGTSVIAAPADVADEIQDTLEKGLSSTIAKARNGEASCHDASGEVMRFEIEGGPIIELTAGDYTRASVELLGMDPSEHNDADAEAAIMALEGKGLGEANVSTPECFPSLVSVDIAAPLGPKLFIWGEPVLRKYYTAYDTDQRRIGFALAKHGRGHETDEDGDNDDDDHDDTDDDNEHKSRRPLLE